MSGSKAPKTKPLNSGLLNCCWAISIRPPSVLSVSTSTQLMPKPILKMRLKKPMYFGLCPNDRTCERHKRQTLSLREHAALMRDLSTIAFYRALALLRRLEPVPGILAARRPGAIMDKSERRFEGNTKSASPSHPPTGKPNPHLSPPTAKP